MTTKHNFVINQGETFDTTFTVLQPDRRRFDLTGYTIRGQVREQYTNSTVLLQFDIEVADPASGEVRCMASAADTAALSFNKAVYDLEAEHDVTGKVIRLVQGVITLSREVTRND